jgi:hypothetical protein
MGMPTYWNMTINGAAAEWNGISAVLINGVAFFPSANLNNIDPYYPKAWSGATGTQSEATMSDACLGHAGGDGEYHYHIMTPCLFNTNASYVDSICSTLSNCSSGIGSWALQGYSNNKALTVIGISKDGHPFFGPYDSNGILTNCSTIDACNGITQSNGSYAYYATETFPYGPSCWGPSVSPPPYITSCSTNTCGSSLSGAVPSISSIFLSLVVSTMLIAF